MADISEKDLLNAMLAFAEMKKAEAPVEVEELSLEKEFIGLLNECLDNKPEDKTYFTKETNYQEVVRNSINQYKLDGGS
jgi:hypothetical protein